MAKFFFAKGHKFPKNGQKFKIFCSITSYAPKNTEKNFYDHWSQIPEMNSRFLKKKPVSAKIQVRLESLPIRQFLRQKFDRKVVKNHQSILEESSLGSKEHLKCWSF